MAPSDNIFWLQFSFLTIYVHSISDSVSFQPIITYNLYFAFVDFFQRTSRHVLFIYRRVDFLPAGVPLPLRISKSTANICIGSTAEEQFFCVIFEQITRIYLLSQVHEKSAINTHFMCNLIAVYLRKLYTRRNVISTLG